MIVSLLLGLGISIAGGSFLWHLNSQNKQQSRGRIKEDLVSLGITIKMLYAQDKNCKQNLTANAWGTTLQELKARSNNGSIRLLYPTNGPSTGVFLASNNMTQKTVVKEMAFKNISLVNTLDNTAHRMDLEVTVSDGHNGNLKPLTIPFYIITDSTDKLVSCFATSYPFINSEKATQQNTTMEDFLCSQFYQIDSVYSPSGKTCLPKPAIVGSN
jgi:hypothetical protein